MANFQVKMSDELADRANGLLEEFQSRGRYSTKGDAFEALMPSVEKAAAIAEAPEASPYIADAQRLADTLVGEVTQLARKLATARSEEREAAQGEIDRMRALADERAATLADTEKENTDLRKRNADLEAEIEGLKSQLEESKAQLKAALGMREALDEAQKKA